MVATATKPIDLSVGKTVGDAHYGRKGLQDKGFEIHSWGQWELEEDKSKYFWTRWLESCQKDRAYSNKMIVVVAEPDAEGFSRVAWLYDGYLAGMAMIRKVSA